MNSPNLVRNFLAEMKKKKIEKGIKNIDELNKFNSEKKFEQFLKQQKFFRKQINKYLNN